MICLSPKQVKIFQDALKGKEINIRELLDPKMTSEARTAIFEKYVGKEVAKKINTLFEEKLLLKNRLLGIENLFSKLGEFGKNSVTGKAELALKRSEYKAAQQERIFNPKENEAFLNELADKKIGTHVSLDEVKKITELSNQIEDFKKSSTDNLLGTSKELLNKQTELQKYINSLDKKPAWRSIRDSMASIYKNLFIGIKTGVKTTTLGMLNSAIEGITRRVGAAKLIGNVDLSLKAKAVRENIVLGAKTGTNTFLKVSQEDNSVFGSNSRGVSEKFGGKDTIQKGSTIAGKVVSGGAKAINVASRGLKYFTIDILHKAPMLLNSSINFVDALDITSSQLAKMDFAKGKNMDANAIFKDALKIEPTTELGKVARMRSQQDAFRVLNINNTPLSDAALSLQASMNKHIPTLGDYIIPMAKVPSSVLYNQLENFGVGFGTGLKDILTGTGELNHLKSVERANTIEGVNATLKIRNGVNTLVRTVGVIGAAVTITMNLNKKDFYSDNYGNSYVKMGNYWLNTEAFGGAGTAVAGMMMARSDNKGYIFNYGKSGFDSLGKAPVVDSLNSLIQKGKQGKVASGFVNSYINPILAQDIEKSIKEQSLNPVLVGTLIRT